MAETKCIKKRHSGRWSISLQSSSALAAGLGIALAPQAQAAIIYTDVVDEAIGPADVFVDLDQDGTDDFSIDSYASTYYFGFSNKSSGMGFAVGPPGTPNGTSFEHAVRRLLAGDSIHTDDQPFNTSPYLDDVAGGDGTFWAGTVSGDTREGFIGIRLSRGGGNYNYGWVRILMNTDVFSGTPYLANGTLFDFAYEDELNTAILAGAGAPSASPVPLPPSLGLMALGAASLLPFRRKRRKRNQTAEKDNRT